MIAMDVEARQSSPQNMVSPVSSRQVARSTHEMAREKALHQAHPQTRSRLGVVVSLIFCTAVATYLVSQYATIVSLNYTNQQLRVTLSQQNATNASLQSTVYELSSPTRILNIAEQKLNMSPATPVVVGTSK